MAPLTPFSDGPGNTASGVQVYGNDQYLEALAAGKEAALSTSKLLELGGATFPGVTAQPYILGTSEGGRLDNTTAGTAGSSRGAFNWDPAKFLAGSRVTKLNLAVVCKTNAVAPGVSFSFSMVLVTGFGGPSGNTPTLSTGTTVTGSTVSITTPGAGGATGNETGDFNAPVGGLYCIVGTPSGTQAAGSVVDIAYRLLYRQV